MRKFQTLTTGHKTLLSLGLVLLLSYCTYVHRYHQPAAPYWDENYYITDAQRELNGIFYMQIHPPLGKQLIALGEALTGANERTDTFVDTEHQGEFPADFSFAGYRLFPTLLSWLGAPLLFLIFLLITKSHLQSIFLSFLYIFDNALIVHNRAAQLDGIHLFFLIASLLLFVVMLQENEERCGADVETCESHVSTRTNSFLRSLPLLAAALGVAIGFAVTSKYQGVILAPLIPALMLRYYPNWKRMGQTLLYSSLGFVVVFVAVWQIHFANGRIINPELKNGGYYSTSDEYKDMLADGRNTTLAAFPVMLRDSLKYVPEYNRGIPKLDLCKSDENGSPFFLWPLGGTSINYRWRTDDGGNSHSYLYLQANPAVWWSAFAATLLAFVILLMPLFQEKREQPYWTQDRYLTLVIAGLYLGYMIIMARMDRVLFLYSYFPPLIFSFILLGLVWKQWRSLGPLTLNEEHKTTGLVAFGVMIFLCFNFFKPFTYYHPLTDEQFAKRQWLKYWNLRCVNCELDSPLVRRRC